MTTPVPTCRSPWPDSVNQQPMMTVDGSIPTLEDTLDEGLRSIHESAVKLVGQQIEVESRSHDKVHDVTRGRPFPDPDLAQESPEPRTEFETARLFLSHLGLMGIEGVQKDPQSRLPPLAMLDSTRGSFHTQLTALDSLPTRFCNTVFVLYCKRGCTKVFDILAGQDSLNDKPAEFVEFFNGLGWAVDPAHHPGFAGRLHPSIFKEGCGPRQAHIPHRSFPYHATIMTEVAFVMPTLGLGTSGSTASVHSQESSELEPDSFVSGKGMTSPEMMGGGGGGGESDRTMSMTRIRVGGASVDAETPRLRGSLQCGDHDCAAMVAGGKKTLPAIFIHKLSSGLYQIAVRVPSGRNEVSAGPLVDGMVVSRRTLSLLVRQTTINICSRFRMESEWHTNISTPFTNRKRKIEEFSNQFAKPVEVAEFFSKLFTSEVK
eukprot:Em0019g178a